MDQILVGRVRRDLARLDPVEPVLAEVEHVVAGDVGDLLVADHRDEVLDRLLSRRFPPAQLVLALAKGLLLGEPPIELQCLGDRHPGFRDGAEKGRGLDGVRLVRRRGDRLDTLDDFLNRQIGDSARIQIPKAPRPGEVARRFVAGLCIFTVPGQPRLPGLDHLAPRPIRLATGYGLRVGVQADPDRFARLDGPIPARDATAEVVKTASFRDGETTFRLS